MRRAANTDLSDTDLSDTDLGDADPTRSADEESLRRHAGALADAVDAAVPGWIVRRVAELVTAYHGSVPPDVREAAADAGRVTCADVGPRIRALLTADVDAQRANPLALLRGAVGPATAVLRGAAVPPVVRDGFAERAFPDDVYDLAPATFADVDPALHEPGLIWGAAKAHVVLSRRRSERRPGAPVGRQEAGG
ncbi:hypothetical protein BH20ACT2_BH20ACT2_12840 [soil metagenome]